MRISKLASGVGCALTVAVLVATSDGAQIQFGVAELPGTVDPHGDSYVVLIDESQVQAISHARALVDWVQAGGDPANSPGATILVTAIAAGPNGINRDYLGGGEPLWSWQPVGPPSFADNTIEILDGWPTFVDQDVDGWIANTNGFIGFWGYTVTAELGPVVPEPAAIMLAPLAVMMLAMVIRSSRADG